MKRLSFLAALIGLPLFAQKRKGKPRNNECPVCETMAPAFKPDLEEYRAMYGPCAGSTGGLTVCIPYQESQLPKSNMVRCKRCNCAFWQDAEK